MTRDADELLREYGPEALAAAGGQVVEAPDGVAILSGVVGQI